jgi:TrmH family RNA methyltransferase
MTDEGLLVVEGPHLLEEALRSTWTVEQVFATAGALARESDLFARISAEVVEVAEKALASATDTEKTQGILSLVRPRFASWNELRSRTGLLVVLDGVQDPGNAGTIARSAEAFGAGAMILMTGSVHIANSKFLRASAGSVFRMPCLGAVTADELLENMNRFPMPLYSLTAGAGLPIDEADLTGNCALVVGSEGSGVSARLRAASSPIQIPTEHVESLNAGVACSLALYEASRQRKGTR